MRKLGLFLCAAVAAGILFPGAPAQARPQYVKAFKETYTKVAADSVNCGVCHGEGGKNKKVLSDYAGKLKEALGGKQEKDAAKIVEGLKAVEKMEYEKGKTYGALLEEGKLPAPAK
jgi:mono/diheme cytochrome c family protein